MFLVNIKLIVFCCQKGADDHAQCVNFKNRSPATKQTLACMREFFFCFLTHDAVFLLTHCLQVLSFFFFFRKQKISSVLNFYHHSSDCHLSVKLKYARGIKTHTDTVFTTEMQRRICLFPLMCTVLAKQHSDEVN